MLVLKYLLQARLELENTKIQEKQDKFERASSAAEDTQRERDLMLIRSERAAAREARAATGATEASAATRGPAAATREQGDAPGATAASGGEAGARTREQTTPADIGIYSGGTTHLCCYV